jgi:hypothetical protein
MRKEFYEKYKDKKCCLTCKYVGVKDFVYGYCNHPTDGLSGIVSQKIFANFGKRTQILNRKDVINYEKSC